MSEATNQRLEAALNYVRNGWALLPLIPRGKLPLSDLLPINPVTGQPGWEPLATNCATLDDVRTWFRRFPDANIGVICGAASGGLVAADFDIVPPTTVQMPLTPRAITHRGEHFYFHSSAPVKSHRLMHRGKHLGEIKAEGGYVVLPPSVHPTGGDYEWAELLSPTDLDWIFAPPPAWATNYSTGEVPLRRESGKQVKNILNLLTPGTRGLELGFWCARTDFVLATAELLGIGEHYVNDSGQAFACVLPGHKDLHPSASLYRRSDGLFVYHDWHCKGQKEFYYLAEVYASQCCGTIVCLGRSELPTWQLRLLVDTGFAEPAPVHIRCLPEGASRVVQTVYHGFVRLLGCKWLHTPGLPTPYTWRFAARWCGVSERHAGASIQELLRLDIIRIVGHHRGTGRPMALFLPSDL